MPAELRKRPCSELPIDSERNGFANAGEESCKIHFENWQQGWGERKDPKTSIRNPSSNSKRPAARQVRFQWGLLRRLCMLQA